MPIMAFFGLAHVDGYASTDVSDNMSHDEYASTDSSENVDHANSEENLVLSPAHTANNDASNSAMRGAQSKEMRTIPIRITKKGINLNNYELIIRIHQKNSDPIIKIFKLKGLSDYKDIMSKKLSMELPNTVKAPSFDGKNYNDGDKVTVKIVDQWDGSETEGHLLSPLSSDQYLKDGFYVQVSRADDDGQQEKNKPYVIFSEREIPLDTPHWR